LEADRWFLSIQARLGLTVERRDCTVARPEYQFDLTIT